MNNKISISVLVLFFVFSSGCENKQTPAKQVDKVAGESTTNTINEKKKATNKNILFFGDSITAGYQLAEEDAFSYLIQQKIDSLGLDGTVINAGLSGDTSSGGLNRVDWVLRQHVDIFLLELGANDALRGLDPVETEKNLKGIIEKVQQKYPECDIILVGMLSPPNMGVKYADQFDAIYPKLAKEYGLGLIPFLLEGVAGIVELNLQDGIHPNKKGHEVLTENVWQVLKDYI